MRAAPAVDAALGPVRFERMLIVCLHAATGAALSVWASAHAEVAAGPWQAGLPWMVGLAGALVLGAAGLGLARSALPAGPARLCWDGAAWQLHTEGLSPLRRVVVAMDLGAWMLLQLVPADGRSPSWRVARARRVGVAWHGLRVALQAHAGEAPGAGERQADPAAQGPGSRP